jgi:hypothetical protein
MVRRRFFGWAAALLVTTALAPWPAGSAQSADTLPTLPTRLTDAEFWKLSETFSEPNGYFRTDNLLSNELYYPEVLPALVQRVKQGGVYLGVGPEQNFHYIVALRPKMVIITDIRRGNLHAQLMYKALFEMSADRAEFVSRLFTKPRPQALSASTSAIDLMQAYWDVPSSPQSAFDNNFKAMIDHLTKTHAFPLSTEDVEGIKYVYNSFYWFGPAITYNSSQGNGGGRGGSMSSYAQLMMATDLKGVPQSFLASEETFKFMKDLESRNLLLPVVGNFGGPRALRAVGQWVREHGATIGAFYLSNVEQYLQQDGIWANFCANVASMPLTPESTFIRSQSGGGGGFRNMLGLMQSETAGCTVPAAAGAGR